MNYISHRTGDLWSVLNSQEILCHLAPRPQAFDLLLGDGYGVDDAENLLANPSGPEQFYPTLTAALEFRTSVLGAAVAEQGSDKLQSEMDDLRGLLNRVAANTDVIAGEIERQTKVREQQREAARQQRARQDRLEPLLAEREQLQKELAGVEAELQRILLELRKKFKRLQVEDLAKAPQYARMAQIRARLIELEGLIDE